MKIGEAKQALETEARERAQAAAEAKAAEQGEDDEATAERVATTVEKATVRPKRSGTSPIRSRRS